MKLRPGVNFTNILPAAFTRRDIKSVKIQSSYQYFFALLGSAHAEVSRKILMKLRRVVNFISILQPAFALIFLRQKFTTPNCDVI